MKKEIKESEMSEFFQGILASIGFLGGICGFIYWVFNLMEKRIETKLDSVSSEISKIANELIEERRSKDYLYKFVIDNVDKK
jgi:ATP-dependent protease HslVU (ClpYQ) peptidase subunit